ncbi:hypothetical protein N7451_002014 [Penicillium sp. IBT 35674x]|nr:hypothetical protein N7451_002014 [Penicillium sp. IBT 35674x]
MTSPLVKLTEALEAHNKSNRPAVTKRSIVNKHRSIYAEQLKVTFDLRASPIASSNDQTSNTDHGKKNPKQFDFPLILDHLDDDNSVHSPSLSTAQSLYESMAWNFIPTNACVLADFGFDQLATRSEKGHLVRLYQDLRLLRVSADELQIWQVEGTLVAKMKQVYYQMPNSHRGVSFAWFLEHTWVLETSPPDEELACHAFLRCKGLDSTPIYSTETSM